MAEYRVLGPTEVVTGDTTVDLGGPRPRRLLTALLAAGGQPVSDDELVETVWGERPPADPVATLQVYVSRLRQRIRDAGGDLVRCAGVGYRLAVPCGTTDADQFTSRVTSARELLNDGRAAEALRELDAALALWRGETYADLPPTSSVLAARARLEELRETAVEERLAARLATGDAAGAIPDLDAAARAAPYRERRWVLLILGLYRAGRQGDALAALRRVRSLLAEELGIDPGPELQRLEQQVLAQDPHLLPPEPGPEPGDTARVRSRLTPPLSTFLGRGEELATLAELVATQRLVTLVGPPGAGKTRLLVEYAAARTDQDGPWLVPLADVTNPRVLLAAVTGAVDLTRTDGDPRERLFVALDARDGLLLLDNCEHLVAPIAELALDLLSHCTRLRIVATSREPLGVDGERTLPVGPLSVASAVQLLTDRITAIRPGWQPSTGDADRLRRLAMALDGIPLALELAAARARVLDLPELTDHLHDHFLHLEPVPRGAPTPHATLEAAITWSVELLPAHDRALLVRLWPFEGGFPLDALDVVPPAGPDTSALPALSSLVTRSLVAADTSSNPSRYRLLETIRDYCRRHDRDPNTSRAAHAAWVRRLVAGCAQDMLGHRSTHAMHVLDRELPNVRAGIEHDLRAAPVEALRAVGQLDWFWYRTGRIAEGQRLLHAALDAAPQAPPTLTARAWSARGMLYYLAADLVNAEYALKRAVDALGDPADDAAHALRAQLHFYDAYLRMALDQPQAAYQSATQAVHGGTALGVEWIVATAQTMVGAALLAMGRDTEGRHTIRAAIDRARACGQHWTAAYTELLLARHMLAVDDPVEDTLPILSSATTGLRQEHDVGNLLVALHAGALALARAHESAAATRLRIAVHHHAARHGLWPTEIDATITAALDTVLGPLRPNEANTIDPLTWDTAVALLRPRAPGS